MARTPIHPGEILADELEALGMSALALAKALHVPANRISQIIAGKRGLSADTAFRMIQLLGSTTGLWINLQKAYELRLAEQESGEEIRRSIAPLSVVVESRFLSLPTRPSQGRRPRESLRLHPRPC